MWSKIDQVLLKDNKIMEVRRVVAPDHYHESRIKMLLPKYSALWMWHLNLALSGRLDDLETRFYVGSVDGKPIGNISTWECGRIGIVGHLFTARKHREKGVCTALMRIAVQDFRSRDGKVLIGGFRPASRRIARKQGFKSLVAKSEVMHLELNQHFDQDYFRAGKPLCRDVKWRDWTGISLLFGAKEGWCVRSMKHRIFGPYDYEDYFLKDMWEMQRGVCQPKVLVTKNGNVIGYAALTLKNSGRSDFWLLDFFIHSSRVSDLDILLDALTFPSGKTRCYVDRGCCEKSYALLDRGFSEKSQRRFKFGVRTFDTIVMERHAEEECEKRKNG